MEDLIDNDDDNGEEEKVMEGSQFSSMEVRELFKNFRIERIFLNFINLKKKLKMKKMGKMKKMKKIQNLIQIREREIKREKII